MLAGTFTRTQTLTAPTHSREEPILMKVLSINSTFQHSHISTLLGQEPFLGLRKMLVAVSILCAGGKAVPIQVFWRI